MHPTTPASLPGPEFDLAVQAGPVSIITIAGELDLTTAPVLTAAVESMLDAGATEVHLDLAGLTFCDSSGFNAFLVAQRALRDHQGAVLVLLQPSHRIRALLHATGLTNQFDIR